MRDELLAYLGDVGYQLIQCGQDRWRIVQVRDQPFDHQPILLLPDSLVGPYVESLESSAASVGLSAYSLIDVHLEESIRSPSALENTDEVGIRRHRGIIEWYTTRIHPDWVPPYEGATPRDAGLAMPDQER